MTINNNGVQTSKTQLDLFDDFHALFSAYEALQVISVDSAGDAVHVGRVINVLNMQFELLLVDFDNLRKGL